jgi:hypothetical protein
VNVIILNDTFRQDIEVLEVCETTFLRTWEFPFLSLSLPLPHLFFFFFSAWPKTDYVAQAGLNSHSSCFSLPGAEITAMKNDCGRSDIFSCISMLEFSLLRKTIFGRKDLFLAHGFRDFRPLWWGVCGGIKLFISWCPRKRERERERLLNS